jgi:hypothetical protein
LIVIGFNLFMLFLYRRLKGTVHKYTHKGLVYWLACTFYIVEIAILDSS